jgi:hypothetical protein
MQLFFVNVYLIHFSPFIQGFNDFSLATPQVGFLFSPPTPGNVTFTFRVDSIAQEPNETFELVLASIGILPPNNGASYFRDTLSLTIIDSDSKCGDSFKLCLFNH